MRYLFVTDGLITRLSRDEVKAIVAHEAAHIRHRHLLLTLVSIGLPLGFAILSIQAMRDIGIENLFLECLSAVSIFTAWVFFQRLFSRMMEYQADMEACRIIDYSHELAISRDSVDLFCQSLNKICPESDGSDWWHPSIASRQALLRKCAENQGLFTEMNDQITLFYRLVCGAVIMLALVNVGIALIG